jgi:hypothetical protein
MGGDVRGVALGPLPEPAGLVEHLGRAAVLNRGQTIGAHAEGKASKDALRNLMAAGRELDPGSSTQGARPRELDPGSSTLGSTV